MKQTFEVDVEVDPASDLTEEEVSAAVDDALMTSLDGGGGVVHTTVRTASDDPGSVYIQFEMRLTGDWGTPQGVARDVLQDLEENYHTDLMLCDPRIINVSRTEHPDSIA